MWELVSAHRSRRRCDEMKCMFDGAYHFVGLTVRSRYLDDISRRGARLHVARMTRADEIRADVRERT